MQAVQFPVQATHGRPEGPATLPAGGVLAVGGPVAMSGSASTLQSLRASHGLEAFAQATDTIADIQHRLLGSAGCFGVAVLEGRRVVAVLSREGLTRQLARPFVRELYYRRPVLTFIRDHGSPAMVLPASMSISDAIGRTMGRSDVERYEPLVVTGGDGAPFLLEVQALLVEQCRLLSETLVELEQQRRTAQRAEAERQQMHQRLMVASREAGRAEVATGVLHNVGNVLNSLNVSASVLQKTVQQSKVENVVKAADLLSQHEADLPAFFGGDERGKRLPGYIVKLAKTLTEEQRLLLDELTNLAHGLEHIKQIVQMQQSYAKATRVLEPISPADLLEDALRVNLVSFDRHNVKVVREAGGDLPQVPLDKHRVLQILINLVSNAKNATKHRPAGDRVIAVRASIDGSADAGGQLNGTVRFEIVDNGVGIPQENLTRIFAHGFTTRKEGHGFGLHSAANAAREMGGELRAHSDGPDRGASFVLELPIRSAAEATVALVGANVASGTGEPPMNGEGTSSWKGVAA